MKSTAHCHVLLPGLCPDLAAAGSDLPALQSLLRHARPVPAFAGDADAWRCRFFGVTQQQDWPVAPFSALGEGLDARIGYWLCANPVHLQLQRDSFTVLDSASAALTPEQAQSLVSALNTHFAGEMVFFAPHPQRWYLHLGQPPALQTFALAEAVGQDANRLLPQGADALKWHARLNEIQMLLHGHPVNAELEQSGALPVNSVWLWGGGVMPQCRAKEEVHVCARDACTLGLMRAHGGTELAATQLLQGGAPAGVSLVVLDQLLQPGLREHAPAWCEALQGLDREWFSLLLQALRAGKISSLALHLATTRNVCSFGVTRNDLYKFWRRTRPLVDYLG